MCMEGGVRVVVGGVLKDAGYGVSHMRGNEGDYNTGFSYHVLSNG